MICKKTQELISYKIAAMKANSYSPELHKDKKYLTLFACHTNKLLKEQTLLNNLKHFDFPSNDIVIVNSLNTNFDKNNITTKILDYFEVENNPVTLDFGKYMIALQKYDYTKYDYVVFINDSIILNSSINHFYNIMMKKNVELYGYNSSSQIRYHYQSYLFGIKSSSVYKLINLFYEKKNTLVLFNIKTGGLNSVINNIELVMVDLFESKDCFLDLAKVQENVGKNITVNDKLINILYKENIFPILKIKRMIKK